MSAPLPDALISPLQRYLDEDDDEAALRAAADWARAHTVDIAGLFDWLQHYPADKARRSRAQVVLRAALGLPLVPGPVCRPTPSD
ncbi:hypothetical protein [Panacagrimonas sp.]|uniref:hypothetical protein n=1 Tax=Panacagrimonas sp. TaxID=2480088 RepID=UPI003B52A063